MAHIDLTDDGDIHLIVDRDNSHVLVAALSVYVGQRPRVFQNRSHSKHWNDAQIILDHLLTANSRIDRAGRRIEPADAPVRFLL